MKVGTSGKLSVEVASVLVDLTNLSVDFPGLDRGGESQQETLPLS